MSETVLINWLIEARDRMPNMHDKAIINQVIGFCRGKQDQDKRVPVRLKSKSVSLQALKRKCKKIKWTVKDIALAGETRYYPDDMVSSTELLLWAEKEASKKNE